MKVSVHSQEGCEVTIACTYPAASLAKYEKNIKKEARKNIEVPGFRKGAVPENIAEKHLNPVLIRSEALEKLIDATYSEVIQKSETRPVIPGEIGKVNWEDSGDVTVEFVLTVAPVATIDESKLSKIQLTHEAYSVSPEEIQAEIAKSLQHATHFHDAHGESHDGFEATSEKIEMNDRATISCQGFDAKGGTPLDGTLVESYPLVIGSGNFIPGFEENLIGLASGDETGFDITFPENYHSDEFKGRKVYFTVTIGKVEKPHTPELTPELIQQLFGFESTPETLEAKVGERLLGERIKNAKKKDEEKVIAALKEISEVVIGKKLIEAEGRDILEQHKKYLQDEGYSLKDMLQHSRTTQEAYFENVVLPEAQKRITVEALYRKLLEIKKPELAESEIMKRFDESLPSGLSEEVVKRLRDGFVPGNEFYEQLTFGMKVQSILDSFFVS